MTGGQADALNRLAIAAEEALEAGVSPDRLRDELETAIEAHSAPEPPPVERKRKPPRFDRPGAGE